MKYREKKNVSVRLGIWKNVYYQHRGKVYIWFVRVFVPFSEVALKCSPVETSDGQDYEFV